MGIVFNKQHLHEYVNYQKRELTKKIEKLEVFSDSEIERIVNCFIEDHTIKPVKIKDPIPSEPIEFFQNRQSRIGYYRQRLFKVSVSIPFEGDSHLFSCIPTTSSVVHIKHNLIINNNSIKVDIVLEDKDFTSENYKKEIDDIMGVS